MIVPRIERFLESRIDGHQVGDPVDIAHATQLMGREAMAGFTKQMIDTKRDEYFKGRWDYPSGWKCAKAKAYKKFEKEYPPLPLSPQSIMKFFYGDLIETMVKSLAVAAGCVISEGQERLQTLLGSGRLDFILTLQEKDACEVELDLIKQGYKALAVEVKSMEGWSFDRWWAEDDLSDMWGYRAQQSACLEAVSKHYPEVAPPAGCAPISLYVAVNKVNGALRQKTYSLDHALLKRRSTDRARVELAKSPADVEREYEPQSVYGTKAKGYPFLGNKLGLQCGYCDWKYHCWGSQVRADFLSGKPVFWLDDEMTPYQEPGGKKCE